MQRTHFFDQKNPRNIIRDVRENLIARLGQHRPEFSEEHNSYFHTNARLTLLEDIAGCLALSEEDEACMPVNLLALQENPSKITISNLKYLIKRLDQALVLTNRDALAISLDKIQNVEEILKLTPKEALDRVLRISPSVEKMIVETKKELKNILQIFILQNHRLNLLYGSNPYDKRFVGELKTIAEDKIVNFKKA